jgi:hypothetical protein
MTDELTKAVDELIDTARACEWHQHFGGNRDKWRDELAYARGKVLNIAKRRSEIRAEGSSK